MCRKAPNQRGLQRTDPGASNGGRNFEIQPLGADLMSFEAASMPQNWKNLSRKYFDEIRPKWSDLDV